MNPCTVHRLCVGNFAELDVRVDCVREGLDARSCRALKSEVPGYVWGVAYSGKYRGLWDAS